MNTRLFQICCLIGLMTAPVWTLAGCGKEVSRTETVKEDTNGNEKKTTETVTRNPDGTLSTEKTKTETKQP